MLAAYLAQTGDGRIGSITLLNTLLDFTEPGVLGAFTDEKTVRRLEKQMAEKGVLDASQMSGTFDMLRANVSRSWPVLGAIGPCAKSENISQSRRLTIEATIQL